MGSYTLDEEVTGEIQPCFSMSIDFSKLRYVFCRICGSQYSIQSEANHEECCWDKWWKRTSGNQAVDGVAQTCTDLPIAIGTLRQSIICGFCGKLCTVSQMAPPTQDASVQVGYSEFGQHQNEFKKVSSSDDERAKKDSKAKSSNDNDKLPFAKDRLDCDSCGHKYLPDRLGRHRLICVSPSLELEQISNVDQVCKAAASHSRFTPCFICGRPYGSKSIIIHEPQCLEKWRKTDATLPFHLRKPEPEMPVRPALEIPFPVPAKATQRFSYKPPTDEYDESESDAEEIAFYEEHLKQLVPCQYCNRTFVPNRIKVHENVCAEKEKHFRMRTSSAQTSSAHSR